MWRQVGVVAAGALLLGGAANGASKTAPSNTSPPTISGTEREGETLTASSGSWSGSTPMTFSFHWQRCDKSGNGCDNISGATSQTYRLRNGDAGHRMRVSVKAANSDGSATAISGATGVIAKGIQPQNTSPPTISGTAKAGSTLTASTGSWSANPTSYRYTWRRCDAAGNNCSTVGSDRSTYTLVNDDVGHTMRVVVRARNEFGSNDATSAPTAVVQPGGPAPANTAPPVISGTPRSGQILVASTGTWTNSPTKYGYQWQRCDSAGNNCVPFGSDRQSQQLGSSEVGRTIRVTVKATNSWGTTKATSVPTAVVTASGPASISVSSVSLPNRLVISAVQFVPAHLTTRSAFLARFRVSDSHGNLVRGALVYSIGIPYGWVRAAPEVVSGEDGWATIQFFPTRLMPLHRAALVMFVRARKPGDNLLAGVSTRRLVQVRIG